MDIRPVGFILGCLISALAAAMLVPLGASIVLDDGEWAPILSAMIASIFVGGTLILGLRPERVKIDRRQGFLLTSLTWTILPLFGALPLIWSDYDIGVVDGIFESVSGLTTTGSTVLVNLDTTDASLLLWRSMLQWLGGIGIVAMGIAILPFLKVGGMQVFRMESSDQSEKAVPRVRQLSAYLVSIYAALTVLCVLSYWLAGMSGFDAINHAMTTVSTGGYSTSDLSFGKYPEPLAQWLCILFMIGGAAPFGVYIYVLRGRRSAAIRNAQLRLMLLVLFGASMALAAYLAVRTDIPFATAFRLAAFNVTSVVTTTGYASEDYALWGAFAITAFFVLTFVGGCSVSTSGGFKMYRFVILIRVFRTAMRSIIRPHAVSVAAIDGRPINYEIVTAIAMFSIVYLATILGLGLALSLLGLDFITALSGAATAVANVGPGLGPTIGPAGNFSSLPDAAKLLLSLGMILGRLEIITMAVLIMPDFWRR